MEIAQGLLLLLTLTVFSHAVDASYLIALSGDKEVPPVSSNVTGTANFTLSEDGLSLDYDMILFNPSGKELLGVEGAHIHCGGATETGPVVLFLAPPAAVTSLEIVVNGTLTVEDMMDSDCSSDIAGFYSDILLARAYVNVHSSARTTRTAKFVDSLTLKSSTLTWVARTRCRW
jgi:hypothetical protein